MIEDVVEGIEEGGDEAATYEKEDDEGEHAHAIVDLDCFVWEEMAEDAAAVERRKRDEVEDEEQQVDEDDKVKEECDGKESRKAFGGDAGDLFCDGDRGGNGGVSGREDVLDDDEQDKCDGGREQVAGGTGEGDEDVVAFVVFEVAGRDGRGLCPADEEASVDQRDEREEDGAEWIEMLEGIECDAAEHHGGGVAKAHSGPGVSTLMDAESEDENDDFEEDDYYVQGHVGSSLLNMA